MGPSQILPLPFTGTTDSAEANLSTHQLDQSMENSYLQVHMVNQWINEVENDKQPRLISLENYNDLNQVFENKDQKKKWFELDTRLVPAYKVCEQPKYQSKNKQPIQWDKFFSKWDVLKRAGRCR